MKATRNEVLYKNLEKAYLQHKYKYFIRIQYLNRKVAFQVELHSLGDNTIFSIFANISSLKHILLDDDIVMII